MLKLFYRPPIEAWNMLTVRPLLLTIRCRLVTYPDLVSVEYPFIAITPKSTLTWSDSIC